MPPPSQRRGLQVMRTQATRKATTNLSSPELYIRLTSLEMERARRVMERDRLLERVQILNERIARIALEQADMRARVDLANAADSLMPRDSESPTTPPTTQFGFTY